MTFDNRSELKRLSGQEARIKLIDAMARFDLQNGRAPVKVKLPVLMAYDLLKCAQSETSWCLDDYIKLGIKAFEKLPLFGMKVTVSYDRMAELEFE